MPASRLATQTGLFMVFFILSRQIVGLYLRLRHELFFHHPLQLIKNCLIVQDVGSRIFTSKYRVQS
jgi:hypothetical protein